MKFWSAAASEVKLEARRSCRHELCDVCKIFNLTMLRCFSLNQSGGQASTSNRKKSWIIWKLIRLGCGYISEIVWNWGALWKVSACFRAGVCVFTCVFTQELEISRERLILQIRAAVTGKDRWLQRITRIHTSRATWHSQHEHATVRRSKNKASYKYLFCHFRAKGNTSDYSPQITVRLFSVPTVWRKVSWQHKGKLWLPL